MQEAQLLLEPKSIPPVIETDDIPRKKLEKPYKAPTAEMIAYLDFSVSTTGVLSGVKVHVHVHVRTCIYIMYARIIYRICINTIRVHI